MHKTWSYANNEWRLRCENDECPMPSVHTYTVITRKKKEAIAAWNHRPTEDALRNEIDILKAAIKEACKTQYLLGSSDPRVHEAIVILQKAGESS